MWLIVFDGKYNYMLFNAVPNPIIERYKAKKMPFNGMGRKKQVEFYSTFDSALDNLMRVIVNNDCFSPTFLKEALNEKYML